ncbi:RNA degradosome polyphosphate kinase [Agrococcus sp. TF02-05]|uniref:RNA degradosome polyphosphate kinase n=1 Tax=Agrococcus sp. TF02-05 TaxID=2815211 RepID=UPI001AA11BDB|nr:RNA degradosome polyphosphate kinase [Agrococcus sp. TF02-05]MBO1769587.1 RNA degradosome polyphosphate kinase [Agrococcus sp. TF02-05]
MTDGTATSAPASGEALRERPARTLGEERSFHDANKADFDDYDDESSWSAELQGTATEDGLPADRFLDRELSWLAFNERVLEMGEDPRVPLLERANFLAIFASNLDEFFMVRVAGLKRRIATGLAVPTNVGRSPQELLHAVVQRAHDLQLRHARAAHESFQVDLAEAGIHVVSWQQLTDEERQAMSARFDAEIFPVLMPLAVDPAHPFPYISGLSLNLAVRVQVPGEEEPQFARLKVPAVLPRFIELSRAADGAQRFLPLEELIANNLDEVFSGMEIIDHHVFRVTRNEDVSIDEDDTENLISALEEELSRRKFGPPIRLEVAEDIDTATLDLLVDELGITEHEVYRLPGLLDLTGLFQLAGIDRPDLRYTKRVPVTAASFLPGDQDEKPDLFAAITRKDVLVHHPYESFATSVQALLEQAADDPDVLAIKQTLYRTSGDSPVVAALIRAAAAGKQVLALVEVKARFDEQANIRWAKQLERAGVHVVYGIVGLKTHCKLMLIVRREQGRLRHYCHIGTGNYNPKTSRIYEDFGLFTDNDKVGRDITRLFNELSGYAKEKSYQRLLVAPRHLRKGLLDRIERETEAAKGGRKARIRFKINAIVDEQLIDALYRASRAGVEVQIWVRGICSIKPGVPGLSENITVRSIVGRYLEHSRVFAFWNDGAEEVFIGSADMMHRNLDRRVEALIQLTSTEHMRDISQHFDRAMSPQTASWWAEADGTWTRRFYDDDGAPLDDLHRDRMIQIQRRKRTGSR